MRSYFRTNVFVVAVLLVMVSPSTGRTETWAFSWSQGGGGDTETFPDKSACDTARKRAIRDWKGMGMTARISECRPLSGPKAQPQPTARPQPGPTAAELQALQNSRQQEIERAQRNAQQRALERERAFERGKAGLLEELKRPESLVKMPVEQDIGDINSPAMRQLVCSASRLHKAIILFTDGYYQEAIKFSRASVGEAEVQGECTVGGIEIPDVPKPRAEIDFKEEMERFQKVEKEIIETIGFLASAQLDMKKTEEKTVRSEIQVNRYAVLVERLKSAPESNEKKEGLEKADVLLAKARAMLEQAKTAEDEADSRLRDLDAEQKRLCKMGSDLSDTLEKEKPSCQAGGG